MIRSLLANANEANHAIPIELIERHDVRQTETILCDRDTFGKETPATTRRKFTLDGNAYLLNLCERHADEFDRELMGWIRLAHDDPYPARVGSPIASSVITDEIKERDRRAAELRERQASPRVVVLDDGTRPAPELVEEIDLKGWVLTPHAIERAKERGFTIQEVIDTVTRPELARAIPGRLVRKYGREAEYRKRGDCFVVAIPDRQVVISVWTDDHERYLAEKAQQHPTPERIAN